MVTSAGTEGKCALNNSSNSREAERVRTLAVQKHLKPISVKTAFWRGLLGDLLVKVPDTIG